MTDEAEIRAFRERFRISLIERLVLKNAFAAPVIAGHLSIRESHKELTEWLDQNSKNADQAFGGHFRDPGLSALYADEVKEIVDAMKKVVDGLLAEMISKGY